MTTFKTKTITIGLALGVAVVTLTGPVQADVNAPLAALGPPPIPLDNKQTPEKIELGKLLFFDTRLSGDASVACSTCHEPKQGWGFSGDISRGYPGTIHWRNSQTVVNSAYYGKLFWAGSAKSLEGQAPSAARGGVAGNLERDIGTARLAFIPEYRKRFKDVFGDEWPKIKNAWRAIAAFERTMVQTDTPFDKYMKGDKSALSEEAVRGKGIFEGKANCIECHNGALFSDQQYYNLGVPRAETWLDNGLAQITFRFEQYAKGVTQKMYRSIKDDAGFYYRTKQVDDKGKFRTPSLRYTLYTAPYMHNGTFFDLQEVVEFYNEGGGTNEFSANKTDLIKPLNLSEDEITDLVAFLESLSGDEIKMSSPKLPPYAPLPNPVK
ncbi:MAG: cytochrome-c peroxidase [Rhodospirillaceae bacterium]|nr:cytochrome-c peroxidase [Rhodospirillaceae bacterium]MBT7355792.1 cytochrome-c peroxidase [Rhodospirillaceae bacterium]